MKVSWRTFDQDKTARGPRRRRHRARRHQGRPAVRGHRRGVVDRDAERRRSRSSRTSSRTRLEPSKTRRAARGQEPHQVQVRREARRRDDVPAAPREVRARHREAEQRRGDDRAGEGPAEHPLRRGRRAARARQRRLPPARARAREHRRHGARPDGHPVATPRSSRSTTSCWSPTCRRTSMGAGQMAGARHLRRRAWAAA